MARRPRAKRVPMIRTCMLRQVGCDKADANAHNLYARLPPHVTAASPNKGCTHSTYG
jgi:hypothetical protein